MAGRPSVIPLVKERLERYLEIVETAYLAQPKSNRKPTLPHTTDFKANVAAIAAALEPPLTDGQSKYLHRHDELKNLVNLVAEGQGLRPIGARTQEDAADEALKARLVMQAKSSKEDAQAAVEAKAREAALTMELQKALHLIADLEDENMRLRAQLDLARSGMLVRVE